MPDISMCLDQHCPKNDTCYRFIAEPSARQSFFCGSPRALDSTCTYYMEAKDPSQRKRLNEQTKE